MCDNCKRHMLAWHATATPISPDFDGKRVSDADWQVTRADEESPDYQTALDEYRRARAMCRKDSE